MLKMQKHLSFMLTNVFIGDKGEKPFKVFLRRMFIPIYTTLLNKVMEAEDNIQSSLKYLQLNCHDSNLVNVLKFLGYWDKYGYKKHVVFASSLRFELLKETNRCYPDQATKEWMEMNMRIRIVYDNEEI